MITFSEINYCVHLRISACTFKPNHTDMGYIDTITQHDVDRHNLYPALLRKIFRLPITYESISRTSNIHVLTEESSSV